MWNYSKNLQHKVKIKNKDIRMAKFLVTQYGGPDGELSAAIRYLNQRYTMPTGSTKGLLTDIGTEELAHVEIISAMVYQLTKDATPDELKAAGLGGHYAQHDHALFPTDANGVPWTAAYIGTLGNPVTDLHEDLAAEQKAKATYEHLIDLTDDHDVKDVLKFLWAREVVHYQRFGEALESVYDLNKSKRIF
ncbi:protein CotJC [Clostridium pasteurianum DSM 525 = ATCC 6013]|uniref:Catalase n=1 Tax=Clostridium pasteurianum DSM 525 = ATCC 6013 TaxID=1262449 RepID=A0A0H3J7F4_CLOPA|nr:manganese catalase family protein [Clostridium pasteurianum]AJA49851.1 protein CotJC [Clostridium pasteurianum DSM 525 = ATCC 6013]AJA53839.1 protein CotJC [Clostridium pasteurianum DSM 525 = ATCC 6013]AOZ76994.1 spore coat protein CotJC [Clostridium pasteurianum DSM 525 = ATCC 6013]AOZ80791.1 spore coat protein CotJC [Clostridium pasteurianum]ELP57810.1 spore coat protein [Clostridium pasteurianum DSM 525 = ATCC 6013]